jgi:hypothetical protein
MLHPFYRDLTAPKKKHPLYYRWLNLRNYVYCKTNASYHLYGGKGIKLCDEWAKNYNNFLLWAVKNGYKPELVICRKDKNGDFTPDNCMFAENSHSTEPFKI